MSIVWCQFLVFVVLGLFNLCLTSIIYNYIYIYCIQYQWLGDKHGSIQEKKQQLIFQHMLQYILDLSCDNLFWSQMDDAPICSGPVGHAPGTIFRLRIAPQADVGRTQMGPSELKHEDLGNSQSLDVWVSIFSLLDLGWSCGAYKMTNSHIISNTIHTVS